MVTLYIDKSESYCGGCNKGADPYEESHITLMGWAAVNDNMKGCGAVYDSVSSHYVNLNEGSGFGLGDRIKEMRPDLLWVSNGRF